jgi:hypothetical protein
MRLGLLLALVTALSCVVLPAAAVAAESCTSPFDGTMSFPVTHGPDDPEEFCWEVNLADNQELRQVDDRNAGVYDTDPEHRAFSITAPPAHDAIGTDVPTTIVVVQPNVIVLTVHHRAGNPAAGGASFLYPVTHGAGWEGGFRTYEVAMPPPEMPPPSPEAPEPVCAVPDLHRKSLMGARQVLRRAGCSLGPIRGERSRGARIVRQYRPVGRNLPAGTAVGVKLAP